MDGKHPSVERQVMKPVLQTALLIGFCATVLYAAHVNGLNADERERIFVLLASLVLAASVSLALMGLLLTRRVRALVLEDEEVRFLAFHDVLSRLPNRALFNARFKARLAKARWTFKPFALALLDLDRFKIVNDVHGHQSGDFVLKVIAQRLQRVLRSTDLVARLGGDEFGVVLPAAANELALCSVLSKMIHAVEEPIVLPNGLTVNVGVSLGVVLCGTDSSSPESLMYRADLALYDAKSRGGSSFVFAPQTFGLREERSVSATATPKLQVALR